MTALDNFPAWKLEDAKARFSEVVRLAHHDPQRVTVRGKDAVVILSAAEFAKLLPLMEQPNLQILLSESPLSNLEFESPRVEAPIRAVEL